jgi:hypothetical protein
MSRPPPARDRIATPVGGAILVGTAILVAGAALGSGAAQEPGGGAAVGFAAAVCLAGSLGGWLLARWPAAMPARRVAQGLAGTAVRLFVPLFALAWLQAAAPGLRGAGAGKWLLIFYLALLAVDIFLTIIEGFLPGKNAGEIPKN